jgi:hypothetical protein
MRKRETMATIVRDSISINIVKHMRNYDPELSYLNKYNPGVTNPWEAIKND